MLTLQNAAPEIDALVQAETPPNWTREAGDEVAISGTPAAPVIGVISAAQPSFDYTGSGELAVSVPVQMDLTNTVPIARIDVSHRLVGAESFTVAMVAGETGTAHLSYPAGATIEVFATAYSVFGDVGAGADVDTFAVTGGLALPTPLELSSITVEGGLGAVALTFATQADTAKVQVFRVPQGDTLDVEIHAIGDPVGVPSVSTASFVLGDGTRTDVVVAGDMSDAAAWTVAGGWSIAGGQADHVPGAASILQQPATFTAGTTYRGFVVVSGHSAGSVTVQLAGGSTVATDPVNADGIAYFALDADADTDRIEILASADFDGAIGQILLFAQTASSMPQGRFDYFIAPITSDDIATAPTGPVAATTV